VGVFAPRLTSTSVSCSPRTVAVGRSSLCTALVSDTDAGAVSLPTGAVSFGSTGAGGFSAKQCVLSGSGASASCSVSYLPSAVGSGSHAISAGYGGDATHQASGGTRAVVVIAAGSSSAVVGCLPKGVVAGEASRCVVTVRDTTAGAKTPAAGRVRFAASAPGSFSARSCVLGKLGAAAARCAVAFRPLELRVLVVTITARYGGDATHPPSKGIVTVRVLPAAACAGRVATIGGTAGADRLAGTRGNDVIVGGAGNDRIRAGAGNDLVCGGPGNDRIFGGPGNDRIFGGPGNDVLFGGPGNDRIYPGPGRDHVFAGPGNDFIYSVDGQPDVIDCGPGHDVAIVDQFDRTRHCETVIRRHVRRQP
jgi:Ca2+-binding RTX toxin-like protein